MRIIAPTMILLMMTSTLAGCTGEDEEEEPTWPLSISLSHYSGPIDMNDGSGYMYSASPGISGGVSPYEIRWFLDGVVESERSGVSESYSIVERFYGIQPGSHTIEMEVMDAAGAIDTSTLVFTVEDPQVWVSDYKVKITLSTFTPRGIPSGDDIDLEFTWDDENTGEFEAGQLCTTWVRSDGDDIEINSGKECIIDIGDESHQVSITACARVDSESNGDGGSDVDIYNEDTTYGSCLILRNRDISGTSSNTQNYNGLDDNDGQDIEYHGHLVVLLDVFDDGHWEDA